MRFVSLGIEEEAHQKGNSFFVFLDPVRRFRSSDYTFTTMKHYDDNNDGSFDDSLQIVATSPSTSDIVLDDKIIGKTWKKMTSIDLSVLTVAVSEGTHRVYHKRGVPFSVLLYGQRYRDAYGLTVSPTPGNDNFQPFARNMHEALYGIPTTTVSEAVKGVHLPEQQTRIFSDITDLPDTDAVGLTTEEVETKLVSVLPILVESQTNFSQFFHETSINATSSENPTSVDQIAAHWIITEIDEVQYEQSGLALELDAWTLWTECSQTCGNAGSRFRLRICSHDGDRACSRKLRSDNITLRYGVDFGECARIHCPVDGMYSDWSEWSTCSTPCGVGTQQRRRTCKEPEDGGAACKGPAREFRFCNRNVTCEEDDVDVYNYADDNTFVCSGYDYESVKDKVVRNVNNVITWFESNNMMVNPDKFQCIVFGKN
ncbi:hypothetical protein LSH36_471g06060 [Paralvinella palmiformis]|uniref:IgGFc-binding protein N-terminal domain-containing protein n=1 Tax=Paralvinella palmiformis TaxID=53620 RepID=A0AAD9MX50_9ANNE|nr:hypothetical protein LSH36_471g06060 [Paralvinella palmiformis]